MSRGPLRYERGGAAVNRTGLLERTFEVSSLTNKRTYSFVCNLDTNVSRWSKNAVEYFGLPGEYIYDANAVWEEHIHREDLENYREAYEAFWRDGLESQSFEYRARNKKGEYVLCTCKCVILKGGQGEPDLFAGTIINHKIYEGIDPVTNLHNNKGFIEMLNDIIHLGQKAAVMKLAINGFSQLNAMYGYEYGNRVLLCFAEAVKKMIAGSGEMYRIDGAKFAVVLLDCTDEAEISRLYEKIEWMAGHEIKIKNITIPLSTSGSALVLGEAYNSAEFVKSCLSFALSQSKHERHGELMFFRERTGDDVRNLKIISTIHQCIREDFRGFYLCYQPIVDAGTERIVGAEALLRWRGEEYGNVPPGVFVPYLEVDTAFYELGNWIIRTALRDAVEMRRTLPDFILNINIAASQLERREFRETITTAVEESGFPPENLFIELTERCRHLDYDFLRRELDYFHSKGMKVSIDDFGTGSSSLSLLKELPFDELKIDMSFIREIQQNAADQAIVGAVVHCANNLQVKSCLEGVEDGMLSQYLKKFNATYYQGYHYSKPVEAEAFLELIRKE